MTKHDLLVEIARTALAQLPPGDESVLACMVALHTNDIVINSQCNLDDLPDSSAARRLHAVTRRHAAEIVAAAQGSGTDRSAIDYWYTRYGTEAPYEVMEGLPEPLSRTVGMAKSAIQSYPCVQTVEDAD